RAEARKGERERRLAQQDGGHQGGQHPEGARDRPRSPASPSPPGRHDAHQGTRPGRPGPGPGPRRPQTVRQPPDRGRLGSDMPLAVSGSPYYIDEIASSAVQATIRDLTERVDLLRAHGKLTDATLLDYYGEKRFE